MSVCPSCHILFLFQAAYIARLQQQAASIKSLLKMLNSSSGGKIVNQNINATCNKSSSSLNETGGYESLWEVSERGLPAPLEGAAEDTAEVDVTEDILDDQQDLYENTCVNLNNFTLNVGK